MVDNVSLVVIASEEWVYERRPNATTGNDKVIAIAHASDGLDNFTLIVCDDFNSLQLDSKRETVFGEESGVGVDGLATISNGYFSRIKTDPNDEQ